MRRMLSATALAVAAVLTTAPLVSGVAHAAVPADDIFYPNDQKPADPAPAPVKPAKPATTVPAPADPAPADATPATTSPSDREAALARGSREAADLLGWMPSLYQGKWYMPSKESVRRCIMDRESNFSYRAVGAGTYFGAYQMNAGLARGATYTMEREVAKEMGEEGAALVRALRKTTPNNWNRYWQDRAFWTIWHNGDGAGHWRGGAFSC